METFEYDINSVIGRLGTKIANLEIELANEQAKNEALIAMLNKNNEGVSAE